MADDLNRTSKLLRILCLHGYRQNAQSFRERTGAFRKITKKYADFVFISAPSRVPPLPDAAESTESSNERGWWFSEINDTYIAQDYTQCCKGYEESLEVVQKAFKEEGPFDGVLGFSQGAALLSLICGLHEKDPDSLQFNFAIIVAGFKSRQAQHGDLYTVPLSIPSLHVYGDTDAVIQKEMSEDLLQYFVNPVKLQHPGGHFIPASGPQKKVYHDFLSQMLTNKNL